MATQALYRAWRPQFFRDVYGQDAIVTTLRNQIASGRVAHAYLFCGSRGTGKTTTAKILARAVNCESPQSGEPCGACATCEALSAENNLDVIEIDAASNNGVDEIRDLRERIKYPPQHGRYRVYIIDEVHMLSAGAFNALLKTLEEPPRHVVFILATTEPQKLPATILSRCQRFDFRRIPAAVIAECLHKVATGEHVDVRPGAVSLIAAAAEGGMRDALSLMDMCLSYGGGSVDEALVRDVLGASDRAFLFDFAAFLVEGDVAGAMKGIDALMKSGREPQVFARDLTGHLRALMLAQSVAGDALAALLEITAEDAARYADQAALVSRERLLRWLDQFLAAETDMKWSSRPRVALEVAAARACLPEDALRLDALAARVEMLEKKLQNGVVSAPPPVQAEAKEPPVKPAPKATEPKAPAPTQPAAPDDDIWSRALPAIKKEPALYAPLLQGRFAGMDGDAARVVFAKDKSIFPDMLKKPDKKEKLEALLTNAAGRPIRVSFEFEPDKPTETRSTRAALKEVFDAFGRENVQVIDE